MVARPPLLVAALAALLLTAGCVVTVPEDVGDEPAAERSLEGPAMPADATWDVSLAPRADGVGESQAVSADGELPVDATRTWRRTERLMNTTAPAPDVTVVEDPSRTLRGFRPSPAQRALGFTNATGDFRDCGRFAYASAGSDEVRIATVDPYTGESLSPAQIELALAHEYAHVLQDEVAGFQAARTTENPAVGQSMSEGSAVIVAESYARQFGLQWGDSGPLALRGCIYQESRNRVRSLAGVYYLGGRYFPQRVDSPAELETAFAEPPTTTEQVIHGETPESEPVAPLSVEAPPSADWNRRHHQGGPALATGELGVRVWLAEGLPPDRVDAAASGWGNDAAVRYDGPEGERGVAWVLRWDSRADAEEFDTAVDDIAGTLEERGNTSIRHVRVAPETVVVFGGPSAFVDRVAASGSNDEVMISPPGTAVGPGDD